MTILSHRKSREDYHELLNTSNAISEMIGFINKHSIKIAESFYDKDNDVVKDIDGLLAEI